MHGVAPQMCGRVASPLLGRGAGGRSPGYLMPPRLAARRKCCSDSNPPLPVIFLADIGPPVPQQNDIVLLAAGARTRSRACADDLLMPGRPVGLLDPSPHLDRPPVSPVNRRG
jgi:hypothetical protein